MHGHSSKRACLGKKERDSEIVKRGDEAGSDAVCAREEREDIDARMEIIGSGLVLQMDDVRVDVADRVDNGADTAKAPSTHAPHDYVGWPGIRLRWLGLAPASQNRNGRSQTLQVACQVRGVIRDAPRIRRILARDQAHRNTASVK